MNVTIKPAAEKFIKRMMRLGGAEGAGFRLSVTSGGCSGLAAEFSVEAAPKTGEAAVTLNGMRFFLPAESRLLLEGVTIDFVDSPMQTGFVFHDPKQGSCGCSSTDAEQTVVDISSLTLRS